MTTTYIVFLKNLSTGEEFAVPHTGGENAHDTVIADIRAKYPATRFTVHTAYTTAELNNILESTRRWPGVASKVQSGTVQAPKAKVDKPLKADSIFAKGSVIKPKPYKPTPAPAKPTITPEVAAMQKKAAELAKQPTQAQAAGTSVIERLKLLKQ